MKGALERPLRSDGNKKTFTLILTQALSALEDLLSTFKPLKHLNAGTKKAFQKACDTQYSMKSWVGQGWCNMWTNKNILQCSREQTVDAFTGMSRNMVYMMVPQYRKHAIWVGCNVMMVSAGLKLREESKRHMFRGVPLKVYSIGENFRGEGLVQFSLAWARNGQMCTEFLLLCCRPRKSRFSRETGRFWPICSSGARNGQICLEFLLLCRKPRKGRFL